MTSRLLLDEGQYTALRRHLIPPEPEAEEVAFVFATIESAFGMLRLMAREWDAIPPRGFLSRGLYHLELTDDAKAGAIRRAHQLGAALVELHSHPYPSPARFSWSDVSELREFAPHVRWRLKGRPYGAIVVSPQSYDSLIWTDESLLPSGTLDLEVGDDVLSPTGLSLALWGEENVFESF